MESLPSPPMLPRPPAMMRGLRGARGPPRTVFGGPFSSLTPR
jgi:hypothetical protein